MCTATWHIENNKYTLFFNRDEQISRQVATPPKIHKINNMKFIAPLDTKHNGTWIGVNERKITVCVLNNYDNQNSTPTRSRGLLIKDLLSLSTIENIDDFFNTHNFYQYEGFKIILFIPNLKPTLYYWNGQAISKTMLNDSFITSSSYNQENTISLRKAQFASYSKQSPLDFHKSHNIIDPYSSVCVHRATVKTVSLSKIDVDEDSICFSYIDGSPCESDSMIKVQL